MTTTGIAILSAGLALTLLDVVMPGGGTHLGYWLDGLIVGLGCMALVVGLTGRREA